MSDEIKKEEPKEKKHELKVSISDSEGLRVDAPGNGEIYDTPTCLHLLDMAKDFIKAHNTKMLQSRIVRSQTSVINRIKGAFGHK